MAALAGLLAISCGGKLGTSGGGAANTDGSPSPSSPGSEGVAPTGDLAFPGAEGFGAYAKGGRDGRTLQVTRLADDENEGSLRWALAQSFPRIVEFTVEGIIVLEKNIEVTAPFLTIDGSTAPGAGITIKDGTLRIQGTHDVIIRHIRVRPGDEASLQKGVWAGSTRTKGPTDAISIHDSQDIIVDHVSTSWCSDEVLSTTGSERVTVQNSFITEPLANPALHIENGVPIAHAYGGLLNGRQVAYIRNYFAYFKIRGPQMSGGTPTLPARNAAVNNLVAFYEGSGTRAKASQSSTEFVILGNRYNYRLKPDAPDIHLLLEKLDGLGGGSPPPKATVGVTKVFVKDNLGPVRTSPTSDEWTGVAIDFDPTVGRMLRVTTPPFVVEPLTLLPVGEVEAHVLANAGATLPRRDSIDERLVRQYRAGQGKLVVSQDDVGGYVK